MPRWQEAVIRDGADGVPMTIEQASLQKQGRMWLAAQMLALAEAQSRALNEMLDEMRQGAPIVFRRFGPLTSRPLIESESASDGNLLE